MTTTNTTTARPSPLGPPSLLGAPFDAASSFLRGAADGPAAIREALHSSAGNSFTEGLVDLAGEDVLGDAGDVAFEDAEDTADAHARVEAAVRRLVADGRRPIVLGGDHSITAPVLRAVSRAHERLTVLHVDAHPDLYAAYEGDPRSHASPFARVLEERLADRLVQVGIRTMNARQREQADHFGVEVIDMRAWVAGRRPAVEGPVYVSIDLDAFDPGFAPGVSHREPGGLSPREVIALVQSLAGPLVGADLVELNPSRDESGITAPLAAKLVKELAGRMVETG